MGWLSFPFLIPYNKYTLFNRCAARTGFQIYKCVIDFATFVLKSLQYLLLSWLRVKYKLHVYPGQKRAEVTHLKNVMNVLFTLCVDKHAANTSGWIYNRTRSSAQEGQSCYQSSIKAHPIYKPDYSDGGIQDAFVAERWEEPSSDAWRRQSHGMGMFAAAGTVGTASTDDVTADGDIRMSFIQLNILPTFSSRL